MLHLDFCHIFESGKICIPIIWLQAMKRQSGMKNNPIQDIPLFRLD